MEYDVQVGENQSVEVTAENIVDGQTIYVECLSPDRAAAQSENQASEPRLDLVPVQSQMLTCACPACTFDVPSAGMWRIRLNGEAGYSARVSAVDRESDGERVPSSEIGAIDRPARFTSEESAQA